MSLHRFPHESVITVSFVTDVAEMPSAVTIIKPLRMPQWTQSESDSWHLPRNTCQSHTTCQIDTHFTQFPVCSPFSIYPTGTIYVFYTLFGDLCDKFLLLLTWVQSYSGQARWIVILTSQIWGIVICQSVLWSLAAGWTVCHVWCEG